MEPFQFSIGVRDFDVYLLPEGSRDTGSQRFRDSVADYFSRQLESAGGTTLVTIEEDQIHVSWVPDEVGQHPLQHAIALLKAGEYGAAVPILDLLLNLNPDDPVVLYNLGMAESDLGHLDRAITLLRHAVELQPGNADAWIALGMALQRNGEIDEALHATEEATRLDPENGLAHRNLGGMLGNQGRLQEAEPHMRAAVRLLPGDQAAACGLAKCLEKLGGEQYLSEAESLYRGAIEMDPHSEIAETARQALSARARHGFRDIGPKGLRMDAVMYCLGALEKFEHFDRQQIQSVGFEIAMLGRTGLDINDPTPKYSLRTLPGSFSGLHLMSCMYVAFQHLDPELDISFDLSEEYRSALKLFRANAGDNKLEL